MHSHLYMSSTGDTSMSSVPSNAGVGDSSMNPCSRKDDPLARPSIIMTPLPPAFLMVCKKPSGNGAPAARAVTALRISFLDSMCADTLLVLAILGN